MPANSLYNYIHQDIKAVRSFLAKNNIQLEHDRNMQGEPYYRIELPHIPLLLQDGQKQFKLNGHHISVYFREQDDQSLEDQYHYTAYFLDEEGQTYQLHVYYNRNDELARKPQFALYNIESKKYKTIDKTKLHQDFISLANSTVAPHVRELRKQLDEKINCLEKNYQDAENKAGLLATDLKANYKEYVSEIKKVEQCLKQLIFLKSNAHYARLLGFFLKLKKSLESFVQEPGKQPEKLKPQKVDSGSSHSSVIAAPPRAVRKKPKKTDTFDIDTMLNDSLGLFKNYDKVSDQEKAELLISCERTIAQLFLLIDEDSKPDILIEIKKLDLEFQKRGRDLFISALSNKNFPIAEKLTYFHYMLNFQSVISALKNRDSELLDFILKIGEFNLNNEAFSVNKRHFISPLDYCFKRDEKGNEMADCLSVLIKHGASLHCKENNRSLSIAHQILAGENHPLKAALLNNQEKTLNNRSFYKRLIADLRFYLNNNVLVEEEREKINSSITDYQGRLNDINYSSSFFKGAAQQKFLHKAGRVEDKCNEKLRQYAIQLKTDPELAAKNAILTKKIDRLLSFLAKEVIVKHGIKAR